MTVPGNLKLVAVEWVDSRRCCGAWEFTDDIEPMPPAACVTVGFILEQTKQYLTIVQTVSEGQVLGRITIPLRAIVKQTKLS